MIVLEIRTTPLLSTSNSWKRSTRLLLEYEEINRLKANLDPAFWDTLYNEGQETNQLIQFLK